MAPNGMLRVSVPSYAPLFMVKRMIASSRDELRKLMGSRPTITITDGMAIGKSHTLLLRRGATRSLSLRGLQLVVTLTAEDIIDDPAIIAEVRARILTILRKEAKAHLPKRISYLAMKHGFDYASLRFTHASSRWGSCNSKKAISLNIALMNLPFELIDYVLIHELAHTRQLNHSTAFWHEVARIDPDFKLHRAQLKRHNPGI